MELIRIEASMEAMNLPRVAETRAMVPGGVPCKFVLRQVGTPGYHPEVVSEKGGTVEHWAIWTDPRTGEEREAHLYSLSRGLGVTLPPLPDYAVDLFPAWHDEALDLWYVATSV